MAIRKQQPGFTIVELLIVVVVIAILAAVTIVAYNGITKRATAASLQSDLSNASTALENDKTLATDASYPTTLALANGGKGIKASNGANYQYTVDNSANPKTYCITETNGLVSYYIDQGGTVKEGVCTGQVAPVDNTAVVTTIAGTTFGYTDGAAMSAQFYNPQDVAIDSSGNIYVADTYNYRIRKITSSGIVSTLAGGTQGFANGTGVAAKFDVVEGVAVDSSGNVYVADSANNRIRKITSSGVVTTLAGSTSGYLDATGTSAQFSYPSGIAIDSSGNVFVTDAGNNRIRKVTSAGVVTTIAGSGAASYLDGTGTAAQFNYPYSIAVDSSGTMYIADVQNQRIRKVTSAGVVTTIAGSGTQGHVDGTGTAAQFNYPSGIVVNSSGVVYVSDYGSNYIRKITSVGVVSTLAGNSAGGSADGVGSNASFAQPAGMTIDSGGIIYVTDSNNSRIRKIQIP